MSPNTPPTQSQRIFKRDKVDPDAVNVSTITASIAPSTTPPTPLVVEDAAEASKDTLAALVFDDVLALKKASYSKYAGYAETVATAWVQPVEGTNSTLNIIDSTSLSDIESDNGSVSTASGSSYDYGFTEQPQHQSKRKRPRDPKGKDLTAPFLVDDMSDASKEILGMLMVKDDAASALLRKRFTDPPDSESVVSSSSSKVRKMKYQDDTKSKNLIDHISNATKGLLGMLMGKDDDAAALANASYVAPDGAKIAYPKSDPPEFQGQGKSSLLKDQMSDASRGLLASLMNDTDDSAALSRANYHAPPGAKIAAPTVKVVPTSALLMDQMSDASRGLLASLMDQGDDASALLRASYVPPPGAKIVRLTKDTTLLTDQMSEASRGLLGTLMGLDDDFAALQNARYVAPGGAKTVLPPRAASSSTLLMDQMSDASKGLLASLMVNSDDVVALQSAVYAPPPGSKIVHQLSFSSDESSDASSPENDGVEGPLLLDMISEASKELLVALVVLKDEMEAMTQAKAFTPGTTDTTFPRLLMHEMSDASRGLLGALMGQGDDVAALEGARYVAPPGAKIVRPPNPTLLKEQMSEASRGLLSSLFGEGDDMAALENARYVAPTGANIVKPPNPTLLKEQMSEASRGLLGSLMGQGDDMSALENARYTAPTGAKIAARLSMSSSSSEASDDDSGPLLMKQMSDASRGLLGSLMGQGDDMAALKSAKYVPPPESKIVMPPKVATLLLEQMSDASKGLLDTLMGLDDDLTALQSARYVAPRGRKAIQPTKMASSATLLMDQMSNASKGLLASLMVNSDDVIAFQSAVYSPPAGSKIVSQDSFSSDELSDAWASENDDMEGPLLLDVLSDGSKELLAALVVLKNDMELLRKENFFEPGENPSTLRTHEMPEASRGLLGALAGQGEDLMEGSADPARSEDQEESGSSFSDMEQEIPSTSNPTSPSYQSLMGKLQQEKSRVQKRKARLQSNNYDAATPFNALSENKEEILAQQHTRYAQYLAAASEHPEGLDESSRPRPAIQSTAPEPALGTVKPSNPTLLKNQMSEASRGLLGSLMGQGDDMSALENARYTAPTGANIVKPPNPTLLKNQMSEASRGLLGSLMSQGDNMAAFEVARYAAPAGASIVKPPNPTLLKEQMSEASRGLLGSLMGQGDDMAAFESARYTAPTTANIVQPPKESTLLADQMSEASKGLLSSLFGQGDDMAAIQRARYVAPQGAKIVKQASFSSSTEESDDGSEESDDGSAPLLSKQMSEASRGLLGSLMGQGDDMAAFQKARYVAPAGANIVKPPNPTLLKEQMSEASRGLLGSLMGQGDDMSALENARYAAPTGANIVKPPNPTLLKEQMSAASRGLLGSLMSQGDDMAAFEKARYTAPARANIDDDSAASSKASDVASASISSEDSDEDLTQMDASEVFVAPTEAVEEKYNPIPVQQEKSLDVPATEKDQMSLLLLQMSAAAKDMLASSTMVSTASKDLLAALTVVSALAKPAISPEEEKPSTATVEPLHSAEEGPVSAEVEESVESKDESPQNGIRDALMGQSEEEIMQQQQARFAKYLAAASALPEAEDASPPSLPQVQSKSLTVPNAEIATDESEAEDESEESEESDNESPRNGIRDALMGQSDEEIMAQQQARFAKYLAAASAFPEAEDASPPSLPPVHSAPEPAVVAIPPVGVYDNQDKQEYLSREASKANEDSGGQALSLDDIFNGVTFSPEGEMVQQDSSAETNRIVKTPPKAAGSKENQVAKVPQTVAAASGGNESRTIPASQTAISQSSVETDESEDEDESEETEGSDNEAPQNGIRNALMGQSEEEIMARQQARFAKYLAAASELPEAEDSPSPSLPPAQSAPSPLVVVATEKKPVLSLGEKMANFTQAVAAAEPAVVLAPEKKPPMSLADKMANFTQTVTAADPTVVEGNESRIIPASQTAIFEHSVEIASDDSEEEYDSEEEDEDESEDNEAPPQGFLDALMGQSEEEIIAQQQARFAKYLAAASEIPETHDDSPSLPLAQNTTQSVAVEPAVVAAEKKPPLSLAEKMANFTQTVASADPAIVVAAKKKPPLSLAEKMANFTQTVANADPAIVVAAEKKQPQTVALQNDSSDDEDGSEEMDESEEEDETEDCPTGSVSKVILGALMGQSEEDVIAQQQARYSQYLAAASENPEVEADPLYTPAVHSTGVETAMVVDAAGQDTGKAIAKEEEPSSQNATATDDILAALMGYDEDDSALQRSKLVGPSWAAKANKLVTSVSSSASSHSQGTDDDYSSSDGGQEASHTSSFSEKPSSSTDEGPAEDIVEAQQRARFAKYTAAASLLPESVDDPTSQSAEQSPGVESAVVSPTSDVVSNDIQGTTTDQDAKDALDQQRAYQAYTAAASRRSRYEEDFEDEESEEDSHDDSEEKLADEEPLDQDAKDALDQQRAYQAYTAASSRRLRHKEDFEDEESEEDFDEESEEDFDEESEEDSHDDSEEKLADEEPLDQDAKDALDQQRAYQAYTAASSRRLRYEEDFENEESHLESVLVEQSTVVESTVVTPAQDALQRARYEKYTTAASLLPESVDEPTSMSVEQRPVVAVKTTPPEGVAEPSLDAGIATVTQTKTSDPVIPERVYTALKSVSSVGKEESALVVAEHLSGVSKEILAALGPILIEQISGASKDFFGALTPLLVAQFSDASREVVAVNMAMLKQAGIEALRLKDEEEATRMKAEEEAAAVLLKEQEEAQEAAEALRLKEEEEAATLKKAEEEAVAVLLKEQEEAQDAAEALRLKEEEEVLRLKQEVEAATLKKAEEEAAAVILKEQEEAQDAAEALRLKEEEVILKEQEEAQDAAEALRLKEEEEAATLKKAEVEAAAVLLKEQEEAQEAAEALRLKEEEEATLKKAEEEAAAVLLKKQEVAQEAAEALRLKEEEEALRLKQEKDLVSLLLNQMSVTSGNMSTASESVLASSELLAAASKDILAALQFVSSLSDRSSSSPPELESRTVLSCPELATAGKEDQIDDASVLQRAGPVASVAPVVSEGATVTINWNWSRSITFVCIALVVTTVISRSVMFKEINIFSEKMPVIKGASPVEIDRTASAPTLVTGGELFIGTTSTEGTEEFITLMNFSAYGDASSDEMASNHTAATAETMDGDIALSTETPTPKKKFRISNPVPIGRRWVKSRIDSLAQTVTPAVKSRMDHLAETVTLEKMTQASMLMTGTWFYAERFSPFDNLDLAQMVTPAIKSRIDSVAQTITPETVTQASMVMTGTWSYAERFSPFVEERRNSLF
jgi:hypothetical protein